MTLHHDKDIFKDVLAQVSLDTGIALNMLEKDYYVTMVLRELVKRDHNFIFKGGTSLSKCFHCISRFSEDIDLCYENYDKLSIGKKRKIKSTIVQVCEDLGLQILNLDKIRSRRVFNRYDIEYPKMFPNSTILKQVVLVEIYPARELPIEGITSQLILDNVTSPVKRLTTKAELVDTLKTLDFDVLLTVGAGDIDTYIPKIIESL